MTKKGSFVAVSTGMMLGGQITVRGKEYLKNADIVYSLVSHPLADVWLKGFSSKVVNLQHLYEEGKHRLDTYEEMMSLMLDSVRKGMDVCGAFYGHAGVFAWVPRETIKRVKLEGFQAHMEPGVSSEACLYSDLGIDPGSVGIQSYEASQFLFYGHKPNNKSYLLLWQIALAGDISISTLKTNPKKIQWLIDYLLEWYPPEHEVIIYEAATLPIEKVRQDVSELKDLVNHRLNLHSTLIVPPLEKLKPNLEVLSKLGLKEVDLI